MTKLHRSQGRGAGPGRSGVPGLGTLTVAAALLVAGCSGSTGRQAGPGTTTTPAGGLTGSPVTTGQAARSDERRPQRVSFLTRAETCERFAAAVRPVALDAVGPFGFGGIGYGAGDMVLERGVMAPAPAAAAAGGTAGFAPKAAPQENVDFSGTNVQEAGVDEPDVVKTNGRLLVTTTQSTLRVLDVSGTPRQVGSVELSAPGNLLLVGTRVLVLSFPMAFLDGGPVSSRAAGSPGEAHQGRPTTEVTVVDLADPAKPTIVRTHTIDGTYVDARLIGGVARLVTRSSPDIRFPQPQGGGPQDLQKGQAAADDIVGQAPATAFLPKGASCADAYVPAEASGVGTIAVQSIDPAAEAPGPAVTVVADAHTVYASGSRLYVATNRYRGGGRVGPAIGDQVIPPPDAGRTAIHAFDITDPAKARYAGSGDVPGMTLNQFSLSEDGGVLRVATTLEGSSGGFGVPVPLPEPAVSPSPDQGSTTTAGRPSASPPQTQTQTQTQPQPQPQPQPQQSQSRVTILRPAGEEWVETGAVDGLGKGERIFAVRFLGAVGYVVTFRQTDPLYVLDLRDVRHPKVTGELKITGYSAYLHPAGEGRLLGLGQEATAEGRQTGTQLALFDVGDPAAPAKLAGKVLPWAHSTAEASHHAFLSWPATGLVVVPIQSWDTRADPAGGAAKAPPFTGAVAFRVGDKSVTEAGRITHPGQTEIDRSLVVGDRLLTLSRVGLATNDLKTLADTSFLTFR